MKKLAIAMISALGMGLAQLPASANAAGEHAHHAPHGGQVKTVGKYHYELVVKPDHLRVYLLSDAMKSQSVAGKSGQAIVQIPGKGKQTIKLAPAGDHLQGKIALGGSKSFVAIVSLELDGKTQSARFSRK